MFIFVGVEMNYYLKKLNKIKKIKNVVLQPLQMEEKSDYATTQRTGSYTISQTL